MTEQTENVDSLAAFDEDDADASGDDNLVEATDNDATEEDGDQDDVDQSPVAEDDVPEDGDGDSGGDA